MTPKQELIAHLAEEEHGPFPSTNSKTTLAKLTEWHKQAHKRHLIHALTGEPVQISLAPPKNPSASRNQDRNWSLNIANMSKGTGWRWEIAGTSINFPDEAKAAANKILGWEPTWEPCGWGWRVKDGRGQ